MATCTIKVTGDVSNDWLADSGDPHWGKIDNGPDTPVDAKWIAAPQQGLVEIFTKESLPAECQTVTEVKYFIRVALATNISAASIGLDFSVWDGVDKLARIAWQDFDPIAAPENFQITSGAVSISKADFDAGNFRFASIGTSWTFFAAYVAVTEIDLLITYTPISSATIYALDVNITHSPVTEKTIAASSSTEKEIDPSSSTEKEIDPSSSTEKEIDPSSSTEKEIDPSSSTEKTIL